MRIYSLDTTDFSYNGYGFLTDIIKAEVYEEINGQYVLNMEYLVNGHLAEYLERENIIVCKVADGTEQAFRIKYIDKNFKTIMIKAYHISYDLADDLVMDIAPTNLQAQAFGRWILNNSTTHAGLYTFNSNITTTASARYVRKNVMECMMSDEDNSMLTKFGGEFKRDNYTITFNTRIGQDTGVRLLIGKNINEIQITTDDTELYTRVVPVGYNGLTLPEIYVDSSLINNYPHPKGCIAKFDNIKYDETGEDPEAYSDINDFYDALRAAANQLYTNGLDKPIINVDIDWVDLSKTKEYENYTSLETIRLGDTLTCDMDSFQYTTRVISTTFDVLLDRITEFQIGQVLANYATTTNATIQELSEVDTSNLLEQAQENASNLLKEAMTGYIYFDYNTGNFYIMDNPDPNDAEKVWRWNLNGLGYSSTGINGTYGLAITMDGSIVADYITTGTLNTGVIQGYDSLVSTVEDMEYLLLEEEGDNTITIEGASKNTPFYMQIYPTSGAISLTYPRSNLYPSSDLFMSNRTLRFTNLNTHQTFDYELPCDLLYYDSTHYDKLTIDGETMTCIKTKMVNYTSTGATEIATTETIEYPFPFIDLSEGDYTIGFINYTNAHLKVKLIRKNDLTNLFASSVYSNAKITQTKDDLTLEVNKKVGKTEVVSSINLSPEEIKINASKIALEGYTTINNGFSVDLDGNMTCNNANINGDIITPSGVLTNLQFGCETWGWGRANAYYNSNGGFIGYNYEFNSGTYTVFQSFLNFSVDVPANFTPKNAKIRLRHSPMDWRNPQLTDMQKGSCKNMRVYEATGLGESGYGNYYGEVIIGGNTPLFTLVSEVDSHTFSDTDFEEYSIVLPISLFNTTGVHNIVVKSTDEIPTGVDINNAYQKLGAKTGILTGILELIGYTNNV